MRMWNVPTVFLCRQHLLGEHNEMHSLSGCIKKGTSIKGYITNGLIETHNIKKRHDELATEMTDRGYNHKSPLHEIKIGRSGFVDLEQSLKELIKRCPKCKERILK